MTGTPGAQGSPAEGAGWPWGLQGRGDVLFRNGRPQDETWPRLLGGPNVKIHVRAAFRVTEHPVQVFAETSELEEPSGATQKPRTTADTLTRRGPSIAFVPFQGSGRLWAGPA